MITFIVRRTYSMVLLMLAVSMAVFGVLEVLPGNNVATMVLGPYSSEEQRDIWLEANGYFEPLYLRYLDWLVDVARGDFGESVRFKIPIGEILWHRLGNTAILGAAAMGVVIPLSLLLGVLAGMREGSHHSLALRRNEIRGGRFSRSTRGHRFEDRGELPRSRRYNPSHDGRYGL